MTFNHLTHIALLAALAGASAFACAQEKTFPPMTRGWAFKTQDGKALYQKICQGCHMADGRGAQGAGMYPALAANPRLASSGYVASNVLNGIRGMPNFGIYLNDTQVQAVANYVRTNFGNAYTEPVSLDEIRALRKPMRFIEE